MSNVAVEIDGMRFLRLDQVLNVVPVSRATLYRMIEKHEFPAPCRLGSSSLWPFTEIRDWSEAVKRARGPTPKARRDEEDFI
jgi:predicted DNA-binding transcriptional regulator AlpA